MNANVHIEHRRHGELVERRDVHNVFTDNGRRWLSELVGFLSFSPDTVENAARIRYFGLGIGSTSAVASAFSAPLTAAYPASFDPNSTSGNEYQSVQPTSPLIRSLERPVRRSGTLDPYPGDPGDLWLYEDLVPFYQDSNSVTYKVEVAALGGELLYSGLSELPISEAALFNDEVTTDPNSPFSPPVAYVHFDTITLIPGSILNVSWSIRFCT